MIDFRLTTLWTEELYREYENILFQYRVQLRRPLIQIADVGSVWGSWNAMTRTIVISDRLIRLHSWDVVIEVLKHEMAHQLASEVYGGSHLHDETFARACERLGVAPWAARASGQLPTEIPRWRDRALSPEDERLLKRAEKLLALANSSNEHEALLAMQKVQELYAKHRLDRLRGMQADADRGLVDLIINRRRKRIEAFETMIYSILGEHFFVRVVFAKLYDAKECTHHQVAELSGTRENVLMAEYVFHFLWNQIHLLWRDYQGRAYNDEANKRSYMMGVLSGFRDKLGRRDGTRAPADPDEGALVARADAELREHVSRRHPRLVSKSWGGGRTDGMSYHDGVEAGGRLTLHRGVGRHDGNKGLLLGS